jgi:hypothetical protein
VWRVDGNDSLVFTLKEFRAALVLAEALRATVDVRFGQGGDPIVFEMGYANGLEVQLVVSTRARPVAPPAALAPDEGAAAAPADDGEDDVPAPAADADAAGAAETASDGMAVEDDGRRGTGSGSATPPASAAPRRPRRPIGAQTIRPSWCHPPCSRVANARRMRFGALGQAASCPSRSSPRPPRAPRRMVPTVLAAKVPWQGRSSGHPP